MLPIKLQEQLNLENVGIRQSDINFSSVSMEGDRYICIQEKTGEVRQLVIVDLNNKSQTIRPMISAESIIMNADGSIIALKEKIEGHMAHRELKIINFKTREEIKHYALHEDVVFWKWISLNVVAFLTENCLYHWSVEGDSIPVKMFDRHSSLKGNQIINYRTDDSHNWLFLIGISCQNSKVVGMMQLYCVQLTRSQIIEAYSACFACIKMEGNQEPTNLICFVARIEQNNKLYVMELGQPPTGNVPFQKKSMNLDLQLQPTQDDFPVAMQTSSMYDVIYIITKYGFLYLFDIETATCINVHRINSEGTLFITVQQKAFGGVIAISSRGKVLSAAIDEKNIMKYLRTVLGNPMLAIKFALKYNLRGADDLFLEKFNHFIANREFLAAATIAAKAPNEILRTPQTMQLFQTSSSLPGEKSPLLIYFEALLKNGKLNSFESIELCKPILAQNRFDLLEEWMLEGKLEYSEQLGDLVKQTNTLVALSIYMRANIPNKVIQCFLENKEFHKIVLYSKKAGYNPDYLALLKTIMWSDPNEALLFAKMLANDSELLLNINKIIDSFLEHNHVEQCTDFLLDILSKNKPEDSPLQTRLLEINLNSAPAVANSILQKNMFSHYDRGRIAQLCEKACLFERALEHYSDICDIKRVLMNSQLINPLWLINYFGTLSVDDTIDCLNTMLSTNMRKNMQLCTQVAVRYCEQLTISVMVDLFERHKCHEGLFNFLASIIAFNTDEDVHFKYIEAACKTNQIRELERICRESNFYNGQKVFEYLKKVKLTDHLAIIIVCDRFNFVSELVFYLYQNNLYKYIELYVQKVNTSRLPIVVGALLDAGCQEDIVKNLISTVPCLFSMVELVQQVESRKHLKLLLPWLELQAENGNEDACIYNSLAKIYIDTNNNAERFLKENKFYDSQTIGKFCENRNPYLAFIAYKRGQCDHEIIKVCEEGALFKHEARYLIERSDPELWAKALNKNSPFRKSLIDQVIQTTLLEVKNVDEIYSTVKAFMAADITHELLEFLERLIFDNSIFFSNSNLQNLLILTAIKTDKSRLMEYINRLDAYDAVLISRVAINNGLHEEVFSIFTKFNDNSNAIRVLINNVNDIERAYKFAERCNEPKVWSYLAEAQLKKGMIKEAINSFINADDPSKYMDVIVEASKNLYWDELTNYLIMARKQIHNSYVDNELLYIYAITKKYSYVQELLSGSNQADLLRLGERCFENEMFEAAKIFFENILNFSALASTCVCLNEFEEAVSNARKANNIKTWKEICFACIENANLHLAQICALNVITSADELEDVMSFYRTRGHFNELISLLESGLGLERAHMGMFTELAILYSNFETAKLKDHLELFWSRLNIPKVMKAALDAHLWPELVFLYDKCGEYDNAISVMINHPTEAWKETHFKEMITKVANVELYYSTIQFYLEYKPLLLNDMLIVLASRINHSRCVNFFTTVGHLTFIQQYLCSVQSLNNKSINEALNSLFIEEDNYLKLKLSISMYDNFDIIALAQKLENHHLTEFRRIAAYLYKENNQWNKSITLCKDFGLYTDAIKYASDSKSPEIVENLLVYFLEMKKLDYFVASMFHCYDLLRPDVVLELSWRYNALDCAMPYFVQVISEYIGKMNMLLEAIQR